VLAVGSSESTPLFLSVSQSVKPISQLRLSIGRPQNAPQSSSKHSVASCPPTIVLGVHVWSESGHAGSLSHVLQTKNPSIDSSASWTDKQYNLVWWRMTHQHLPPTQPPRRCAPKEDKTQKDVAPRKIGNQRARARNSLRTQLATNSIAFFDLRVASLYLRQEST
jgi:hypothetical protein